MPSKFVVGDRVRDVFGLVGTIVRLANGKMMDRGCYHLMRRDDGNGIGGAVYWWARESTTEKVVPEPAPSRLPEEVRGSPERVDRTMQAGGVTTIVTTTPIYARDGGRLLRHEITTERLNVAGRVTYSETEHRPAPVSLNRWPYTMSTGTFTMSGNPTITVTGNFTPSVDTTTVLPIEELASRRTVATNIAVERPKTVPEKIAAMSELVVGHMMTPPSEQHGFVATTVKVLDAKEIKEYTDKAGNMMYGADGLGDIHISVMMIGALDHALVERLLNEGRGSLGWFDWPDAREKAGLGRNKHISPAFGTMWEVDAYWNKMWMLVMEHPWAHGVAEQPKLLDRASILLERMKAMEG